jgi:hypothetical protein
VFPYSTLRRTEEGWKSYVASLYFKCLRCFLGMLQVFHVDVTNVDRDIIYFGMVVHVYCKLLFPIFNLFSRCMLEVFTWMLHMFHTYVAYILSECCIYFFLQWFQMFFRCFCKYFRRKLQVFLSDVCYRVVSECFKNR